MNSCIVNCSCKFWSGPSEAKKMEAGLRKEIFIRGHDMWQSKETWTPEREGKVEK